MLELIILAPEEVVAMAMAMDIYIIVIETSIMIAVVKTKL
jgi:hypothetical protein